MENSFLLVGMVNGFVSEELFKISIRDYFTKHVQSITLDLSFHDLDTEWPSRKISVSFQK